MATISIGRFALTVALAGTGRRGPGLAQRFRAWLRHRRTLAELAEADDRTRRDLGLPPATQEDLIHAFEIDPVPLWGLGEVPQPRLDRTPRGR